MRPRQFFLVLLIVLLSVVALSVTWEFWLEDLLGEFLGGDHAPEDTAERWEYIITAFLFSLASLIYPAILGRKMILEHQSLYEKYLRSSREDYLTGLHNRRQVTENLSNEINRCNRYRKTFSLIMLDIDHFKQTNDGFGHLAGDALLIQIADIIREETRSSDLTGRWGGEEFVIICPETDIDGAGSLANNIRERLQRNEFSRIGRKTASFGVAAFDAGEDIESIVHRADEALYRAKQAGRNRVELATSGAPTSTPDRPPE